MARDWPDTLPQAPLTGGFSWRPTPSVIATPTEVGGGKRRRRSTLWTTTTTVQFRMTATQLRIFEAWFRDDLRDGALAWTWRHPVRGTAATWVFDAEEPYLVAPRSQVTFTVSLRMNEVG